MKVLTIRQPWASLIAVGVKTIETRSWSTKYRGPLAIHAGLHQPVPGEEHCGDSGWYWEWDVDHGIVTNWRTHLHAPAPLGAVVATCTLADVVPIVGSKGCVNGSAHLCVVNANGLLHSVITDPWPDGETEHLVSDQLPFGDFTTGRYAWLLEDITPCDPVPAKGRQGLWDWEAR